MIRKAINTNEDVLMLQKLAKKTFYDTFVANLRECMNNLLERNVTFK